MEILMDVTNVEVKENFTLLLEFENSQKRIFDMKPYLEKKPFNRLKSPQLFNKATIAHGTVVWPGNIDIDPETLWVLSVPA